MIMMLLCNYLLLSKKNEDGGVIMLDKGIVGSNMPLIPIVFRLMLVTAAGVSLALLTNPSSPMGFGPRNKDPFISM